MGLADALAADRAGEIVSAAEQYERVLAAGDRSLVALLNLAVLYWQATDPGLAAPKGLRPEFLESASRRFVELLDEAVQRFPGSTEAKFWTRYIAWADLGEPLNANECRQLLREDRAVLVPALYLFANSEGREAVDEAGELLRLCREEGTTRARYVSSVLEGVMTRA